MNGTLFINANENAPEALRDFNAAIDALYRLDVGALSGMRNDIPTDVEEQLYALHINYSNMASKLSLARSLIFRGIIDWNVLQGSDAAP